MCFQLSEWYMSSGRHPLHQLPPVARRHRRDLEGPRRRERLAAVRLRRVLSGAAVGYYNPRQNSRFFSLKIMDFKTKIMLLCFVFVVVCFVFPLFCCFEFPTLELLVLFFVVWGHFWAQIRTPRKKWRRMVSSGPRKTSWRWFFMCPW